MLEHLRIKNFKAWKDTGPIRLAPLTVFFGANSSGKSSITQFLLMLRQTVEQPDLQRVLHFGDDTSLVELGGYEDVVFGHDPSQSLEFEIGFAGDGRGWSAGVERSSGEAESAMLFRCEVGPEPKWPAILAVMEFEYRVGVNGRRPWTEPPLFAVAYEHREYGYAMHLPGEGTGGGEDGLPEPTRFYGFPSEVAAAHQGVESLTGLTLRLETQLKLIRFLGGIREQPKRIYLWRGGAGVDVGDRGQDAVAALLASQERLFDRGPGFEGSRTLPEVVASWLGTLGIAESFTTQAIADNRQEYEALVRTPDASVEVRLPEVGFGVSQVLPVVVQCFCAAPGSTTIFEQPEIHLHPAVQTKLGDLLVEALRSRENGRERNVQFLIESHSEHLLRRIQRRVAEGVLRSDEVALYFCQNGPDGATMEKLKVDEDGNITNWPEGFFGDDLEDLMAMTEAAARRQGVEQQ